MPFDSSHYKRVSEVIDGKRREYTIPAISFDPEFQSEVDKPALNHDGTQVPPKFIPESLSSSSGDTAATPKEIEK